MDPVVDDTGEVNEWELSKENVQPLRRGRKFASLTAALQPPTDDQAVQLKEQRQLFESELRAYDGGDPLDVWHKYIEWIEQNFPRGGNGCDMQHLLQNCVTTFKDKEQYKNDARFLNICIKFAGLCPSPVELFAFLYSNGIGCQRARFYTAWADMLEAIESTTKADYVYQQGLKLGATPADVLARRHAEFQARVARKLAVEMQEGAEGVVEPPPPQRTALGGLRARGAKAKVACDRVACAVRRQQGGLQLAAGGGPGGQGTRQVAAFTVHTEEGAGGDGDGGGGGHLSTSDERWQQVPDREADSENTGRPTAWTDARVKNKYLSAASQPSGHSASQTFVIHEDDDVDQPMATPRKVLEVCEVLSARKVERVADPVQQLQQQGVAGRELPMYDKEKVYAGVCEFSLEEIRAAARGLYRGRTPHRDVAVSAAADATVSTAPYPGGSCQQTVSRPVGLLAEMPMYWKNKVYTMTAEFSFEELRARHRQKMAEKRQIGELKQQLQQQQSRLLQEQEDFADQHNRMMVDMCNERAQLKEQMDMMLAMQQKMEQRQPQGQPPQRTDEDADDSMTEEPAAASSRQPSLRPVGPPPVAPSSTPHFTPPLATPQKTPLSNSVCHSTSASSLHLVAPSPTVNTKEAMQQLMGMYNEVLDSTDMTHSQFLLQKDAAPKPALCASFRVFEDFAVASDQLPGATSTGSTDSVENSGRLSAFRDMKTTAGLPPRTSGLPDHTPGLLSRTPGLPFSQGAGDDAENVARVVEEEEEEEEMEVGAPELTFAPTSCSTQNFNGVSRLGGGGGATTTFDPLLATTTFNTGPTAVAGGNETRQLSMCASQYKTQDLSPIMESSEPSDGSGQSTASQMTHNATGPPPADRTAAPPGGDVSAYHAAAATASVLEESIAIDPNDPFDERLVAQFLSRLALPLDRRQHYFACDSWMPHVAVHSVLLIGDDQYEVENVIGKGAYATVYRATCIDLESERVVEKVIKVQYPACPWEFYISSELQLRLAKTAVDKDVRPSMLSIDHGYFFNDGSYLVNDFHPRGTILDLVNAWTELGATKCNQTVILYFAIELLHMVEQMHACQIIHGDIKPDNFLVRSLLPMSEYSSAEQLIGARKTHAFKLIDFGRSIDMTMFPPGTTFTAKVDTNGFRCPEMRSDRPWTYQTDLFSLIATIHVLCFGDYMKIYQEGGRWRSTSTFKRYWHHAHLWKQLFDDVLNVESCEQLPDLATHRRLLETAFLDDVQWGDFCRDMALYDRLLADK